MSSTRVESGRGLGLAVRRWVDSWAGIDDVREHTGPTAKRVDWPRILPFALLHVACLAVLWVGWSPVAVGVAIALYFVRMFAITAFYHRYFSHRTFRTSRLMQFLFAALGNSSVQRGPLWWAAHHREHHQHSDPEEDPHGHDLSKFIVFRHPDVVFPGSDIAWFGAYDRATGGRGDRDSIVEDLLCRITGAEAATEAMKHQSGLAVVSVQELHAELA